MKLQDKVAVITGGSGGIGCAMGESFLANGARAIVLVDIDEAAVAEAAKSLNCDSAVCDVCDEQQIVGLVEDTLKRHGAIDLFCSNAGAIGIRGVGDVSENDPWKQQWDLHVMSHLYAARAVLPSMLARGEGYLLNTASAAGLLASIEAGPYTVTKAAAIKLAEYLAITYGDDGIRVSVLCPQWVDTALVPKDIAEAQTDVIIDTDEVARCVIEALADERFHVLPHPEVADYVRQKGEDIDRWLSGMRKLRQRSMELADT